MEALWTRFFPAYQKVRELLNSGVIGEVTNVFLSFGVPLEMVERCKLLELAGGATIDIGIYCLQLALLVYGTESPVEILSSGNLNESGADETGSTTIKFTNEGLATFVISYRSMMPNEAFIIGTKGNIKVLYIILSCFL